MCKSWELQKRGALHVHAMLRFSGPCSFADVSAALEAYRSAHWFGESMTVDAVPVHDELQIARRAGYVAKYCTKGYDDLQEVPMLVAGFVQRSRLAPFSKSNNWGSTLAECRQNRRAWVVAARGAPAPTLTLPGGAAALDLYTDSSTTGTTGSDSGLSPLVNSPM
jgi:hypothetical protein